MRGRRPSVNMPSPSPERATRLSARLGALRDRDLLITAAPGWVDGVNRNPRRPPGRLTAGQAEPHRLLMQHQRPPA